VALAAERRNLIVLVALVAVLAGMIYRLLPSTASTVAPATPEGGTRSASAVVSSQTKAPDVHLDALEAERPKPSDGDRNLFRFKPRPVPPPRVAVVAPPPVAPSVPSGPPPPPAAPPIALKFIGIVEAPERSLKVAVLSDSFGVYYGREGETVLGQYKIIRIGAESLEISYLDGRGRQTIRLSGS
jgi:hypothetical protein